MVSRFRLRRLRTRDELDSLLSLRPHLALLKLLKLLVSLAMELEHLLKTHLDHLESSLRRIDGIESERARAGDLPFVNCGVLAHQDHAGYEKVRVALEDTFGLCQPTVSKLGGDLGAILLAATVQKLLAAGELESNKTLGHAIYLKISVQVEVDTMYVFFAL